MSVKFVAVQWNARKLAFDAFLGGGVLAYLVGFLALATAKGSDAPSEEILLLRATGSLALILLHIALAIGPLARLDRRFAPLLYNRRHLGVVTFIIGLTHAVLVSITYFGFAEHDPLYNLLASNGRDAAGPFGVFPLLGFGALIILFLLAATSHDFWQKLMGPTVWKNLHMLVYVAYALLVAHVALGALRSEFGITTVVLLVLGAAGLTTLHLSTAIRELRRDWPAPSQAAESEGWVDAGPADTLGMDEVRGVKLPGGERVAVIRDAEGIHALHGVCAHQGGPLAEGRVIDGCLTCPWHGWQYRPADGRSPPPFEEWLLTYRVRRRAGRLQVLKTPQPAGTPTTLEEAAGPSGSDEGRDHV
ncbi:MAG: Rieske 2Fe-2S domain-containing protein [Myxococcota bacterium]